MDPPLRERRALAERVGEGVDAPATRAMMARTAALLAGAGASSACSACFVPGDAQFDDGVLLAAAAAVGAPRRAPPARLRQHPDRGLPPDRSVLGTAIATAAAYGWGTESAYGPLPYVWVAMFAFYFFTRGAALVHLALMAAAYALALVLEDPAENPLDGWVATVASLLVAGLFVSMVRDHIAALIRRLSDAAHRDPSPAFSTAAGSRTSSTPSSSAPAARTRSSA